MGKSCIKERKGHHITFVTSSKQVKVIISSSNKRLVNPHSRYVDIMGMV